jgi:hypothetical protein
VTLEDLKSQWNAILDDLEARDRIAWLALFDARLAHLESGVLTLDFSDVTKFANPHGFERDRRPRFTSALADSISRVTGEHLSIEIAAELPRDIS